MLDKYTPEKDGANYVNNQPPKTPSKFLWWMEAVFIILSVIVVVVIVVALYLAASNSKKTQEATKIFDSSAALSNKPDDSQAIAKNEPAVVRIAAAYCPSFDLRLGSLSQNFTGACSANYGSGFIISPEGYIATNGHVVKSSAGEVLASSIELGNLPIIKSYLNFLTKANLVSQATANEFYENAAKGDKDAIKSILFSLSDSALSDAEVKENSVDSVYAVQLSDEAVMFEPTNLKAFSFDQNIVRARLVDVDYNPYADISKEGFSGSDVAILKLETGSDYPYSKLGTILGLGQGSRLSVLGFPGLAENELVSKDKNVPSSTQGTVSSIRNASGTENKLIQTDASISEGNSGGPALDANGDVVGLATYKISNSSGADSKINYMRDIQDVKNLVAKSGIKLPKDVSGSQKIWEQGLYKFSKAYYSSAIVDFKKIKSQYPQNRLVDSFIARAEDAKTNGKEATDPNVYFVLIGAIIAVVLIPTAGLFYVIQHHHKRRILHDYYLNNQETISGQKSNQTDSDRPAKSDSRNNQNSDIPQAQIPQTGRNIDMISNAPAPPKKP